MPTIAREIDALGGAGMPGEGESWSRGYSEALSLAEPIAEDADALVEELLETITDMLDGNRTLDRWVTAARTLVGRVKHQRSL